MVYDDRCHYIYQWKVTIDVISTHESNKVQSYFERRETKNKKK